MVCQLNSHSLTLLSADSHSLHKNDCIAFCLIIRTERAISTFTYQSCASKHLFMNSNHIDRLKMDNIPYQFQKSAFLASGTNCGFRNLFHRTWKWNMAKIKITHLQYLPCKCSWRHSDQITSQQDLL